MKIAWVLPDGERTKRYNKLLKNGFVKNDNGKLLFYDSSLLLVQNNFWIISQVQFQNLKHKQDFSLNN